MSDHYNEKILSSMSMVWLKAGWFRGGVKLQAQDITLGDGGKLPPDQVARLGTKLVIDPSELAVFGTLVKRAERVLLAQGLRFMGGYAVPNEYIDSVLVELRKVEVDFRDALRDLTNRYNDIVNDWIGKNSEFADAIRRSVLPVDEVEARCHFRFRVYGITVPEGVDASATAASEVATMGDTLLDEVAVEVREIIRDSIDGKPPKIKITILRRIEPVRRKLKALAFLDRDVKPVLDDLNAFITGVPDKGPIEGSTYHWMVGVLTMLADPVKVRNHAQALRQGVSADVQDSMFGVGVTAGTTGDLLATVSDVAPVAGSASGSAPAVDDKAGEGSVPVFVPPPEEDDDDLEAASPEVEPQPGIPAVGFVPPDEDEDEDAPQDLILSAPVPVADPVKAGAAAANSAGFDVDDGVASLADTDTVQIDDIVAITSDDGDLFGEVPPVPVAAQAAGRGRRPLRGFNFSR